MYVQDYDERYPLGLIGTSAQWPDIISTYTKSKQVLVCPSYPSLTLGYGANWLMFPYRLEGRSNTVSMASIKSPSSVYMLMDSGAFLIQPRPYSDGNPYSSSVTAPAAAAWYLPGTKKLVEAAGGTSPAFSDVRESDYASEGRHFDGINITFADGHAKWVKTSVVFSWAKNFDRTTTTHPPNPWDPDSDQ